MRSYIAIKLRSIRLTPPICAHALPDNARAYINYVRRTGRSVLSLLLSSFLSPFRYFLLSFSFASRKSRIEFIKNTTGSPWDDRDEEKVNAANAVKLSCVYDAE